MQHLTLSDSWAWAVVAAMGVQKLYTNMAAAYIRLSEGGLLYKQKAVDVERTVLFL